MTVRSYNPSSEEAEKRGALGLTNQLALLNHELKIQ